MGHPPIIVAIDQKGVPVAPFIISETYTVEENTAALAEVSIDSYAWYDGAELAQLDPINFAGFEEYAVLLLKVSHNDKAAHWWTGCFMGDLSNPDEYSDRSIINNLVTYGIPEFKDAVDQLLAVYWDENTICGVAADAEGNYGPVIRQVVNLTKEGASPAGELIGGGLSNINLMDMRQANSHIVKIAPPKRENRERPTLRSDVPFIARSWHRTPLACSPPYIAAIAGID